MHAEGAGTSPTIDSPAATPVATPTPTATAPTGDPVSTSAPVTTPPAGPVDAPGAKALAVQACETVADGFAADRVAAAAPLAADAASRDGMWAPLATNLEFIRTHPIDPQTGAGPQKTVEDSSAVARDCFTLAGVTVSQD